MACGITMTAVVAAQQKRGADGNFTETSTQCLRRLADAKETLSHETRELLIKANPNCGIDDGSGGSTPPITPPVIPATSFDVTLGEDTSKLIRGYKDPASAVGGFGSIDTTAFGPSTLFAIEFRHNNVDPQDEFDEIEVILKDANPAITEINILVEGKVVTLANGNGDHKVFYQHSKADPRIATIYAAIMAKTLGSHLTVKLSAV